VSSYRILICVENTGLTSEIKSGLNSDDFRVDCVNDLATAGHLLRKGSFDLCFWGYTDTKDLETLRQLKSEGVITPVISTSSEMTSHLIVNCIRAGASDFWCRELGPLELQSVLNRHLSKRHEVSSSPSIESPVSSFIGRHPKIQEIFRLILSIKDTDSNVLITGESGTGKEVVAKAIHELSPRKKLPFVAVNCGAIPASLLESELFGHMKGSFTGATANRMGRFQLAANGTLFLDEISDLSPDLQAKILRAIQQKVYEPVGSAHSLYLNARVIAATNQNLEQAVKEKKFREDLFYRLNVIPINLPPLRERKSDIPLLVKSFVDKFSAQHKREISGITEDSMRVLVQYHWPGNIRELENLIERVVILKQNSGTIQMTDLPLSHFQNVSLDRFMSSVSFPDHGLDLNEAINDFENELILQALKRTQGNKNKAASLLNLNRTTLVEKLKRKGLKVAA